MQSLSAEQIVRIWELGQGRHPLDRALVCLAHALPEFSVETLAMFSLGQRDAYLLTLRELTFGSQMQSLATCPQCQTDLEFVLDTREIRVIDPEQPMETMHHWGMDEEVQLTFRTPNSLDLAAVVDVPEALMAQRLLLEQCLQGVSYQGQAATVAELSDAVLEQLSRQMAEADPQAEITLDLSCLACGHTWDVLFDVEDFFWRELTVQAQRLCLDVHRLAQAYGWREIDILSMSSLRRQSYLDLVSG